MSSVAQPAFKRDPFPEEFRAVTIQPDDDAARLRYAEQCGGPRADLIRTQVKLAALPGGMDHPEAAALEARANRLLDQFGKDFLPAWHHPGGFAAAGFDRGFVECVEANGDVLERGVPIDLGPIRHLSIKAPCTVEQFNDLLISPSADRVVTLCLDDLPLTEDFIQKLIGSRAARRLRWLSAQRTGLTEAAITLLARFHGALPALERVFLAGNPAPDPVERLYEDQGAVVDTEMPEFGRKLEAQFGRLRWLHPPVVNGCRVPGDRLAMGRGSSRQRP